MRKQLLLLILVGSLIAQPGLFNPFAGVSSSKEAKKLVGSWVEYNIDNIDEDESGLLKLSITGQEKCDSGKECFWFELEMKNKKGDRDIVKYLVSDITVMNEKTSGSLIMVIKHNDEPAQAIQWDFNTPENKKEQEKYYAEPQGKIEMNEETITVPAGTFKCAHIISRDEKKKIISEAWVTPEIPIIGVVKAVSYEGKKQSTIVLNRYGLEGAKSSIAENPKPVKMNDFFKKMMAPGNEDDADENKEKNIMEGIQNIFGR